MLKVKAKGNEAAEHMWRRFQKICEKEGLMRDIKRRMYYESPSEERRRKRLKAKRRRIKETQRNKQKTKRRKPSRGRIAFRSN